MTGLVSRAESIFKSDCRTPPKTGKRQWRLKRPGAKLVRNGYLQTWAAASNVANSLQQACKLRYSINYAIIIMGYS